MGEEKRERGSSPPSTRKAEMASRAAGERPAVRLGKSSVPEPTTMEEEEEVEDGEEEGRDGGMEVEREEEDDEGGL